MGRKSLSSNVNINLQFSANADRAKREVAALQQSLHQLVMQTNLQHLNIDEDIHKAVRATAELQAHLEKAINTDTGNLDFSKLNQSLKSSGQSLEAYAAQLLKMGPQGEQAFMQLASAVAQSEIPLRRVSERLQKFGQTLANTARWQLSSSILQGFTGAIQSAYGYAQDLNESLNNIRIVTGASIDDMAKFAKEANKAAKALSTTTTEYTNASLIYYQQGLSESEVKERANVTIKLANVSRKSAEDVSNQLTAIWNNFYDGSESLEHYADVLTALGAATASSTDEIAGGLEKFAAIANTIGLSYDYAAAALATLTSNTRESEEVVGTALKTIFARIQGLSLGETLEDGTTLNKYSQALLTVGINIKDTSGNLKDMDAILDEMGSKWNTLSRDQQAALAQTVAGTRQYNQLMALMANWNNGDSDSFKANLSTAKNASGSLDQQADIYAESWDAASKRVKAAAESMFDKLLNDEAFIDILNAIEKIINGLDKFIERIGGLRGVLLAVGAVATKVLSEQMASGLKNAAYTIQMLTPNGRKKIADEKAQTITNMSNMLAKGADESENSQVRKDAAKFYEKQLKLQSSMVEKASQMSEIEKLTAQNLMDQLKVRGELLSEAAKEVDLAATNRDAAYWSVYTGAIEQKVDTDVAKSAITELRDVATTSQSIDSLVQELISAKNAGQETTNIMDELKVCISALEKKYPEASEQIKKFTNKMEEAERQSQSLGENYANISKELKNIETAQQNKLTESLKVGAEQTEKYTQAVKDAKKAEIEHTKALKEVDDSAQNVEETIEQAKGVQKTWSDAFTDSVSAVTAWVSVIQLASNAVDALFNDELTIEEKLKTVLSSLLTMLPMLMMALANSRTAIDTLNKAFDSAAEKKLKDAQLTAKQTEEEKELAAAKRDTANAAREQAAAQDVENQASQNDLNNNGDSPFEFTDSKGKQRKYSGRTNKDGRPIDDRNNPISDADIKKFDLQGGKIPGADAAGDAVQDKVGDVVQDKVGDAAENAAGKVAEEVAEGAAGKVAEGAAGKVAEGAGGGLKSLLGKSVGKTTVGKIAGGAAVVAAVAVAATIAYKELEKVYNKNELAAQRAQEAANKLKEEYSKAKSEYEALIGTIDKYSSAKNSMQELTRGTAEFTEALMSANEEALNLLDNYGDVIAANGGYTTNSDGLIEISDTALEAVRKEELKNMQSTQASSMLANRKAKEARLKADATELNRKKIKSDENYTNEDANRAGVGAANGAVAGAAAGAVVGSFIPVIGNVLGAVIGAAGGAIIGGVSTAIVNAKRNNSETENETKALEMLASKYEEVGASALDDKAIKDMFPTEEFGNLADELIANKDEVGKLVKEMAESNTLKRAENLAMANQILANNTTVQESEHADYIGAFVADKYGEASEKAYDDIINMKATNFWGKGTDEWKDVWSEYAESTGLEDLNGYEVKNYKKDGSVVYQYIDEEGKKQKATVTKEQIAAQVAADRAAAATEGLGEQAVEILKDVDSDTVKLMAGAKNKNMSESTLGDLLSTDTTRYNNLSEAELQALGFTGSKADIIASIQAQQAAQVADIQNLANDYGGLVGNAMSTVLSDPSKIANVAQGTLKQYAGTMDKIVTLGGSEMVEQFNTFLTGVTAANQNQADAIMATANSIDWSQGETAIQDFNYQLLKMGINIDENSNEWQNLVTSMQSANVSVLNNSLDSVRQKLTEIKSLTEDIEIGGVISDEDYDNLIKYNAALADQFMMTADGYMYIGKQNEDGELVNDIGSIADDIAMRQLEGLRDANTRAKAASSAMSASGYNFKQLASGVASADIQANAAAFLAGDDANAQAMRAALGISQNEFADLSTALNGTDAEAKKNAQDKLKQIYADLVTIQGNDAAGQYSSTAADSVWASTQSYDTLVKAKENGTINATVADNYIKVLEQKAAEVELEEAERYRDVNRELEKQEQLLSRINSLKTSAFGKNNQAQLLALEAKALADAADAQQKYVEEIKNNIVTDSAALKDYQGKDAEGNAIAFTYDDAGNITNYDEVYSDIYNAQLEAYNKAKQDLAKNNIDQATFDEIEKSFNEFQENTSNYESTLTEYEEAQNALIDKNNQYYTSLVTGYTNTLSQASEEIDKYTQRLAHQSKKIDYYKNLISLVGGEKDYKAMDSILLGQSKLAENNLAISKDLAKTYQNEADKYKKLMDEAKNSQNTDLFELYKQQWEAAAEKSREAEDQMLSDLQSWAESEKAILENTLADLGQSLEKTLTGGQTFDELTTSMDRAQSLQEEYLTTTNKIYETTKMMRTAQQAIDASSNAVAKEKLKNFINETQSLQDQSELSQYELDMQQAKYDLLVAEIALEEAQNAKNTVRLQRDSEGNFGYVYTADAGAMADAQQKFDDAENALYNKGLEGANNYAQKYQQTMSEMTQTLQEIQSNYLAGSYASEEEYQATMTEARSYYTQQLQTYTDLYGVATQSNTDIINEAWSSSCDIMSTSINEVNDAIDAFASGASAAFKTWQDVVATVNETTGGDLTAIANNIKEITSVSDTLTTALTGENGVLDKLAAGFKDIGDTIKEALQSWTGFKVSIDSDGNLTFAANSVVSDDAMSSSADGGYTGAWGPEGKIGILHEKEMILTKDETSQFFKHLDMMESILSTLDFYAANQQLGSMLTSPVNMPTSAETLEQNVKIEASFPGVTDRNEIEEAFNNLVNKASQYANRK